jgi:hypothetical protein
VNATAHRQLNRRKRRIARRIENKPGVESRHPMMTASNIHYEVSDRTRAIAPGGIGAIHLLAQKLGLVRDIDEGLHLLKRHLPYHESDHVLNIAYNLLAGGQRLEHLEVRRNDEVYLDALGARRIPDPTTAGDFCRRSTEADVEELMGIFNETRLRAWKEQPEDFFDEAFIDADGTLAPGLTHQDRQSGQDSRVLIGLISMILLNNPSLSSKFCGLKETCIYVLSM